MLANDIFTEKNSSCQRKFEVVPTSCQKIWKIQKIRTEEIEDFPSERNYLSLAPDVECAEILDRHYDPEIGRWMSRDPILFNGEDTNLYGYTLNSPVNYVDPDGRIRLPIIPALGAVVGALANVVGTYLGGKTPTIEGAVSGAVGGAAATLGAGAAAGGVCGGSMAGGIAAQTITLITGQLIGLGMSSPAK